MEYRRLGRTGTRVSAISLGTWAMGCEEDALATLYGAFDLGVGFFDTPDVHGAGRDEELIDRVLKERPGDGILVPTLERVMNLGKNRIGTPIHRLARSPAVSRFPHS